MTRYDPLNSNIQQISASHSVSVQSQALESRAGPVRVLPGQARIEPEDQSWLKRSAHILTHIPRPADARNLWILYMLYRYRYFAIFSQSVINQAILIRTRDHFWLLIVRIFILGPTEIKKKKKTFIGCGLFKKYLKIYDESSAKNQLASHRGRSKDDGQFGS